MSTWLVDKLHDLDGQLRQSSALCRRTEAAARAGDELQADKYLLELACRAERITLDARSVMRCRPRLTACNALCSPFTERETWGVQMLENGWYRVVCPRLMPSKEKGNVRWLRESLLPVLDAFFKSNVAAKIDPAVLIVRTIYPTDTPERWMTDHDNMEFSEVTDLVALYTMATDNPAHCSNYYCSARSVDNEERTEIYVVPQRDFPIWLREYAQDEVT